MTLQFISIADPGVPHDERLVYKAEVSGDVGQFAVFCTLAKNAGATTAIQRAYWFPDYPVNAGDLVVLYTKVGAQSSKSLEGPTPARAHFFYWGRNEPLWKPGTAAVLLHVDNWKAELAPVPDSTKSLPEMTSAAAR